METEENLKQKMKKLRREVVLILKKNNLHQAKYKGSMIRGAGQYITSGYIITNAISFFDIEATDEIIFQKVKEVLTNNKINFDETHSRISISTKDNIGER